MITFDIKTKCEANSNQLKIPNFRKANFQKFKENINKIKWESLFNNTNSAERWDIFKIKIMEAQHKSIPNKIKRNHINVNPKWYTNEIGQLINRRKHAYNIYIRNKNDRNLNIFNESKRNVKRAVITGKRNYEMNIAKNSKTDRKKILR